MEAARLRNSVPLSCPAPTQLRGEDSDAADLIRRLQNDSRNLSPLDTIGLEQKVAFLAIGRVSNTKVDNEFWRRKCRSLLVRPSFEALFLPHCDKLQKLSMDEAQITAFCSLLCGVHQQLRAGSSYGLWHGADVRFEEHDRAASWYADIQAAASDPKLRTLMPAYVYARTIMAHPYPDGNGRLARALLLAFLTREANVRAPAIALAPAIYRNAAQLGEGIQVLSQHGDWNKFSSLLVGVLLEALVLARGVR